MTRPLAKPTDPCRPTDDILVIAHRGGAGLWPENTLHAFREVTALGADVLEIDIHATKDGHLVVAHDPTVDRCTDGQGLITNHTLAQLQQLDAGYRWTQDGTTFPFRGKGRVIPTLATLYDTIPDIWVNIDIKQKDPAIVTAFARFIRERDVAARTMVGSFDVHTIESFRRACPETPTAASVKETRRLFLLHKLRLDRLLFRRGHATALQVPQTYRGATIVTPRFVKVAHRHGLAVHVWTINDKKTMHQLIDMGVDGIVTDYPDRLKAVKTERQM